MIINSDSVINTTLESPIQFCHVKLYINLNITNIQYNLYELNL